MVAVFLPGVGFRQAGLRLVSPVAGEVAGRTITLCDVIATPSGTELTYDLTRLDLDDGVTPRQDTIVIRSDGVEHTLARGRFSLSALPGGLRRMISSHSPIPPRTGQVEIAITIERLGEFRLAAELAPFDPDTHAVRRDVDASTSHEGITIAIRGIAHASTETAMDLEVLPRDSVASCIGLGGYHSLRSGPTALALRDETGRQYAERWNERARGARSGAGLALFEPLHPEAHELELTIPFVFVEEEGSVEVALPVTSPVEAQFGRYRMRVLRTAAAPGIPDAGNAHYRGPALGVDLDLGGWQGDRRVLMPGAVHVDGAYGSVRLVRGLDCTSPEPVDHLEVPLERPLDAKTLTFVRPHVQVRGPWRIRFGSYL